MHYKIIALLLMTVLLSPFSHARANDIQMLPPVSEGSQVTCGPGSPRVLTWDGQTAVSCASNMTVSGSHVNVSGTVTANSGGAISFQGNSPGSIAGYFTGVGGVYGGSTTAPGIQGASSANWGGVFTAPDYGIYASGNTWAGIMAGPFLVTGMAYMNGGMTITGPFTANDGINFADGSVQTKAPAELATNIATLRSYHGSCTGGVNTITSAGAFTAWCTAACNRYCVAQGYHTGLINEYDGNRDIAGCGCF